MKRVTVILDDEVHKELKLRAVTEDSTILKFIAKIVREYLETKKE